MEKNEIGKTVAVVREREREREQEDRENFIFSISKGRKICRLSKLSCKKLSFINLVYYSFS